MMDAQGNYLVNNFAHNVPAAEGDLERVTHSELERELSGIPIDIQTAETVRGLSTNAQDATHSTLLLGLLAFLLLGEQLLAYSASYHAPEQGARQWA
jgi:hypothetical protein